MHKGKAFNEIPVTFVSGFSTKGKHFMGFLLQHKGKAFNEIPVTPVTGLSTKGKHLMRFLLRP